MNNAPQSRHHGRYDNSFFYRARDERRAVVLGVPYDLRNEPLPNIGMYRPSADVLPRIERIPPPGERPSMHWSA
jgi:hypothetical protein